VVVGSGEFATQALERLQSAGATAGLVAPAELPSERAKGLIRSADALVMVEHHERRELIGAQGLIGCGEIKALNPELAIAHLCGGVDQRDLDGSGLRYLPRAVAPAGYMSVSTSYLGPRPVVELHAAGLRVGQAMAEARGRGLRGLAAEKWVLEHCEYAQGFAGRH
jgi:hypothetical protein